MAWCLKQWCRGHQIWGMRMKQWRPLEATRRQTAPRAAVGAGEGLPNVPACVVRVWSPWDWFSDSYPRSPDGGWQLSRWGMPRLDQHRGILSLVDLWLRPVALGALVARCKQESGALQEAAWGSQSLVENRMGWTDRPLSAWMETSTQTWQKKRKIK